MIVTRGVGREYQRARGWLSTYDGTMASELRVIDGVLLVLRQTVHFPHTLREVRRLRRGGTDPDEVDIAFLHYLLEMEYERFE